MNDLLMHRTRLLAAANNIPLVWKTATTDSGILTFSTQVSAPMISTFGFIATQEGSGDPSFDNVRPIVGWTGANIVSCGKNLFDAAEYEFVARKYLNNRGVYAASSYYKATEVFYSCPYAGKTLTISGFANNTSICSVAFYSDSNESSFLLSVNPGTTSIKTVTVPTDAKYMRFCISNGSDEMMIVEGSDIGAYEPYQGTTLPITFTDPSTGDPLTVYGGTVILNADGSADLTVTHVSRALGSFSTIGVPSVTSEPWVHRWRPQHWHAAGGTWEHDGYWIMCSTLKEDSAQTNGTYEKNFGYIYDDTISTVAEFREKYADTYVLYKLKQQFYGTYHFDSVGRLKSFLGTNNLWSDLNGSITAQYRDKT